MCGCKQGTCKGNCPCGCKHTAPDMEKGVVDCPAALNILGEHFACDMGGHGHALAHANRQAGAIWQGDRQ